MRNEKTAHVCFILHSALCIPNLLRSALRIPHSAFNWRSHVDLHHELPPSQGGVQNSLHLESPRNSECEGRNAELNSRVNRINSAFCILHSALKVSAVGLAPTRSGLKGRSLELLCIHGPYKVESGECRVQSGSRSSPRSSLCTLLALHLNVPPWQRGRVSDEACAPCR